MAGTMIMVSGMPGAGKSTFARWLSEQLGVPVVNYDRLLRKVQAVSPETEKGLAYALFLFELEEHMGSLFIADYIFSVKQEAWLEELTKRHGCRTVNVHFDCSPQTAWARYTARNAQEEGVRTRPGLPFGPFEEATRQNRSFLFGDGLIRVDTEDFEQVSYEKILGELREVLAAVSQ